MRDSAPGPARTAWFVLAAVSLANLGNFYVYDSIGPVAGLLEQQRGFSDTEIGLLNAIYSLPNVVLLLVGGLLVDRYGARRPMLATAALCLAGALLTAFAPGFDGMAAGRLLFGVGAETFNICTLAAIVRWFQGRHLAFAMGLSIAFGRAGAFVVDLSPTWIPAAYAAGWQPPLVVAAAFAGLSLAMAAAYAWLDRRHATARVAPPPATPRAVPGDWRPFGAAYWQVVTLCALWYAVIFAFRSTFSIKYFQHVYGLDLAAAGAINGYVFLAALVATPLLGWVCDRIGRHAPLLFAGALLLPFAIAALMLAHWSPWIGTALIGVSFSLVPAVLWPLVTRLVPADRLGTALAIMWVVLNAAIAGANLAAGMLNDAWAAGPGNPAGYRPMMLFFLAASATGACSAAALWLAIRAQRHAPASRPG